MADMTIGGPKNVSTAFTSELDPNIPEHLDEIRRRVFGDGYEVDRNGEPIEQGRGSASWFCSKLPRNHVFRKGEMREQAEARHDRNVKDWFGAHIKNIRLRGPTGMGEVAGGPYLAEADAEAARVNALRKNAGLSPLTV